MPNPVIHFEIGCRDLRAAEFYTSMFGWTTQPYGPAAMIDTGSKDGIQGHITALGHEPFHYTIFYVMVDDVPAAIAKAESLGGKVVVPVQDAQGYGKFAWIADPEGNTVGLFKPAPRPA